MKIKYYLRGLGTGILFATIILFVSYSYKMSDSQIRKEAEKLGMVYVGDQSETTSSKSGDKETGKTEQTTAPNKDSENESLSESADKAPESTTPQQTSTEQPTTPEQTTTPEATTEPPTSSSGKVEKCEITVTGRTTSYDVAYALKAAGIIDDAEEFNDYLCDNGYDRKIQNGKYTITSDMSYKEIGELICKRNY